MIDYSKLKENEINFQNAKYERTLLQDEINIITPSEFEKSFLTPVHLGGHKRGLLFERAVKDLLSNDIEGKKILDYCCGRGDLGIYLAMKGAIVSGFDLSNKAIEIAQKKAIINHVNIDFRVMDAAELSYPDNYFDFVIGFEALHHVIIFPNVPSELTRILKHNGKAIFAENWGSGNLLFQLIRKETTLRKNRSAERGEVILGMKLLHSSFDHDIYNIIVDSFSLLYLAKKYINNRSILRSLLWFDHKILRLMPFLKNYCGEAVITLEKE